jgi:hypothetical protein
VRTVRPARHAPARSAASVLAGTRRLATLVVRDRLEQHAERRPPGALPCCRAEQHAAAGEAARDGSRADHRVRHAIGRRRHGQSGDQQDGEKKRLTISAGECHRAPGCEGKRRDRRDRPHAALRCNERDQLQRKATTKTRRHETLQFTELGSSSCVRDFVTSVAAVQILPAGQTFSAATPA